MGSEGFGAARQCGGRCIHVHRTGSLAVAASLLCVGPQDLKHLRCLRISTVHGAKQGCSTQCREWLADVGSSTGMEELTLNSCWGFMQLSGAVCMLSDLQRLDLRWCKHACMLPEAVTLLQKLEVCASHWVLHFCGCGRGLA